MLLHEEDFKLLLVRLHKRQGNSLNESNPLNRSKYSDSNWGLIRRTLD